MRISDWSSDVCSSDLAGPTKMRSTPPDRRHRGGASWLVSLVGREVAQQVGGPIEPLGPEPGLGEALRSGLHAHAVYERLIGGRRSEERRGGKECGRRCRSRVTPHTEKKKRNTHD